MSEGSWARKRLVRYNKAVNVPLLLRYAEISFTTLVPDSSKAATTCKPLMLKMNECIKGKS